MEPESRCTRCWDRTKERSEGCWERLKSHSGMVMIIDSLLLFCFGCFFLIAAAYIGATYTTQTEQSAVIAAGIAGGLLILFSLLGAIAYRKGHGCFTYLLFYLALLLFLAGIALVAVALVYLKRIEAVSGLPSPFPFSQNITDPGLRQVSDYMNSIYTTCCSGCPVSICNKLISETPFCPNQFTLANPPCEFVFACPSNQPNCFFDKGPNNTIPPFEIGQGICTFLKGAAWGQFNTPVVGNLGTDPTKVSCGGGDPKVFAFSIRDWLFQQYAWVSAILGIVLFVLLTIMVAALAYDSKSREDYVPKKTHDAMRPFA